MIKFLTAQVVQQGIFKILAWRTKSSEHPETFHNMPINAMSNIIIKINLKDLNITWNIDIDIEPKSRKTYSDRMFKWSGEA